MYLLFWIPIGLVVGWLAGKSPEGNGYGQSLDVMGAGGAVVGGLVMRAAGFCTWHFRGRLLCGASDDHLLKVSLANAWTEPTSESREFHVV